MAERPVFVSSVEGSRLVQEVPVNFTWHPGMAPSQKKKNIVAMHEAAAVMGLGPLLEISSKSDDEIGRRLSAFSLKLPALGMDTTLESAFQGSKVFERGGPFIDLYGVGSRDAKRDTRLQECGRLVGFRFDGRDYPLSPSTVFYDWLYLNALYGHREWLTRLERYAGYTDIEYNPKRSVNCQARSFATFVALQKRTLLEAVIVSFDLFRNILMKAGI